MNTKILVSLLFFVSFLIGLLIGMEVRFKKTYFDGYEWGWYAGLLECEHPKYPAKKSIDEVLKHVEENREN